MKQPGLSLRGLVTTAIAALAVLAGPVPAYADPPGPTDYQTEVVSVEPPHPAVEVEIVGGDSFLLLAVQPGTAVEVPGYDGEPYLRFGRDGVVVVNEESRARWLNDDRYGDVSVPAGVGADAEPEWVVVADDGRYAWHDHRIHWMNPEPPPGAEPGEVILEDVVPLTVDEEAVAITVRSRRLASPSALPALAGAFVGLATMAAWFGTQRSSRSQRDRRRSMAAAGGLAALLGAGVGFVDVMSVPPETDPSIMLWLVPALAAFAFLAAVVIAGADGGLRQIWAAAFTAVGGAELLVWAWTRRTAVMSPIIPSPVPNLDRFAIVLGAFIGAAALAAGLYFMLTGGRHQEGATAASRSADH